MTISFDDGYRIVIGPEIVAWSIDGKGNGAKLKEISEVPPDSDAAKFLNSKCRNISDYLWAPCGEKEEDTIIRGWNGVREAIIESQMNFKQICHG